MPGRTNWTRMTQLGWRVRFKYVSLPLPLHVVLSIACISPPCPLSRCRETPDDPTWVGESIPPPERNSSPAISVVVIRGIPRAHWRHAALACAKAAQPRRPVETTSVAHGAPGCGSLTAAERSL